MNPSTSGFSHAPVSKAVLLASAGASVFAQAAKASRRQLHGSFDVATQLLVFKSPAELLFGAFLVYYFRLIERQNGSSKFGAFVFVTTGISYALQYGLRKVTSIPKVLTSGPYGYVFACFIQYLVDVPASSKFSVLGWRLSDKAFIYLAGLQLLLSGGTSSLVIGGAGLVAGVLYKTNFLGLKRFKFPKLVNQFFERTIGQLLSEGGVRTPGQAGAARPRAQGQAAAAGRSQGAGPSIAAPEPSQEALQQLLAMGFDQTQAVRALQLADNDLQAAIAMLV